jgi:hypothetical protein
MSYDVLSEAEKAHWNEYTNLRRISDWPGFDAAQDQRRAASRQWIIDRREYLVELANGDVEGEPAGWGINNRKERYDFLGTMNSGAPAIEVSLPCTGAATDTESVYIEEREVYLAFKSTTDAQRDRKLEQVNWLVERRKVLWRLMQDESTSGRRRRYDDLCIATHYGAAYERWDKTHDEWGKSLEPDKPDASRKKCVSHARGFIGVKESPANSNKGRPQPSEWQRRVYGDDGVPWCACFTTCMAWDADVQGSATASVQLNIDMAKRGQGMYRGYTTDRSKVHSGDHVAIGCSSCHIELVAEPPDANGVNTIGGNTSPGAGAPASQYNGGCVASRRRGNGEIVGFLLVRFPE